MRVKKPLTYENALNRVAALCSGREQCSGDIVRKLSGWGVSHSDTEKILEKLEEYRFLDDRRFSRAFAHDKLCYNGWGKKKIYMGLLSKRIPRDMIHEALENIDESEYREVATKVVRAKARSFGERPLTREEKIKVIKHALTRGFEYSLISEIARKEWAHQREE